MFESNFVWHYNSYISTEELLDLQNTYFFIFYMLMHVI